MTTMARRATNFELVIAPALDGTAKGALYLDDGVSIEQKSTTNVSFAYKAGKLTVKGALVRVAEDAEDECEHRSYPMYHPT